MTGAQRAMRDTLGMFAVTALAACGQGGEGKATARTSAPPVDGAAAAAAVTTEAGRRPETRRFRDWHAVCDNGNRCAAYTGSDVGGWLMVRMDAGPQARPEVLVGLSAIAGADTVEGGRLIIDGRDQPLAAGPNKSRSMTVPAADTPGVLARLASARAIRVGGADVFADLPTAGASAALLWIDEQQGRLNTETALIRRGPDPADRVPLAPALPEVTAAGAARAPIDQGDLSGAADPQEDGDTAGLVLPSALEAIDEVRSCRAETAFNEYLRNAVLAARLDETTELWGVPCSAGAYNVSYAIYVTGQKGVNPSKAELPSWEARPTDEDLADEWLVNPVYDVRTRTLSHFPRGRGIGDCGVQQSWTWTGGAFVLREEKVMGECWGMSPALWPTTWRSR